MTKASWLDRVFAKILSLQGLPSDGATATEIVSRELSSGPLRRRYLPDREDGRPYSAFTTEFDQVCRYEELPGAPALAAAVSMLPEPLGEQDDLAITVLIDHSGSMRNENFSLATSTILSVVAHLETMTSKLEILGFTTRAWQGGRSREAWVADGRPPRPGRLNDVLHLVYRSHDDSPQAGAGNAVVAAMSLPDLAKENIDGEALEWAAQRLAARPETRKLLILVSDGAPFDDSTRRENGESFLAEHLQAVIDRIDREGHVRLVGVGIKHEIPELGRRAVLITNEESLDQILGRHLREGAANDPPELGEA